MGIQKLGITVAEQCARYVKACGKTSILQTKPINTIQLKGLKLAPDAISDTVKFTEIRKPSVEKLKELKKSQGLDDLALKDSTGKFMYLGKLDDACYITENNSLFLERLTELFPPKPGNKVNTEVQKRMLYLQDINHTGFSNKEEFLQNFLKDIDEVENIKALDGGLLYSDSVVSLYSKKAILQAKYNNPERYQDLQDLLTLYNKGLIPRHNVSTFFPEGQVNKLVKGDMLKLLAGDSYYPQLKKLTDSAVAKLEIGEVFSVGKEMFVKTAKGYEKLKIDAQTYEKLFPALERYSISQSYVGNCGKISSWNAMIKNPNSRIELYKMFEQTENGVKVTIPRKGYISEFYWDDLSKLNTENNLQGGLGHKMLEYTYDINKSGSLDIVGNSRAEMIEDILGLPDLRPRGFEYVGNPTKLSEYCSKHKSGIFVTNGGNFNLNKGQTDGHYYSSIDLSSGIWQNPWTGVEDLRLGFDCCASGSLSII
ncbi:MAG: hypothetical protein ACI37Q_02795 [Candidatus Gastranaerophilaceae bacterium]